MGIEWIMAAELYRLTDASHESDGAILVSAIVLEKAATIQSSASHHGQTYLSGYHGQCILV